MGERNGIVVSKQALTDSQLAGLRFPHLNEIMSEPFYSWWPVLASSAQGAGVGGKGHMVFRVLGAQSVLKKSNLSYDPSRMISHPLGNEVP